MTDRETYTPGPARVATIEKNGDEWTLVLVREVRHSPEKVWRAITDPAHLCAWSPFDADRNLGTVGPVTLTTVGVPQPVVAESYVTQADAPHLLQVKWGDNDMRWELHATGEGTRLTLWAKIDRRFIAMGAAGWHVCLDVMDRLLEERPIGRIVGYEAMKFEGWQRLHKEYAEQFGVSTPGWGGNDPS